jgi:hypothetical protein
MRRGDSVVGWDQDLKRQFVIYHLIFVIREFNLFIGLGKQCGFAAAQCGKACLSETRQEFFEAALRRAGVACIRGLAAYGKASLTALVLRRSRNAIRIMFRLFIGLGKGIGTIY